MLVQQRIHGSRAGINSITNGGGNCVRCQCGVVNNAALPQCSLYCCNDCRMTGAGQNETETKNPTKTDKNKTTKTTKAKLKPNRSEVNQSEANEWLNAAIYKMFFNCFASECAEWRYTHMYDCAYSPIGHLCLCVCVCVCKHTLVYMHERERRIRERFNFIRFQNRQQFPYATIAFYCCYSCLLFLLLLLLLFLLLLCFAVVIVEVFLWRPSAAALRWFRPTRRMRNALSSFSSFFVWAGKWKEWWWGRGERAQFNLLRQPIDFCPLVYCELLSASLEFTKFFIVNKFCLFSISK